MRDFFKIAYKYIRNVALMDDDLRWNNYFLRPKTEIILYFQLMRIISGKIYPPKAPVRPTTDI
jgi:hypothetical protein